MLRGVKKKGNDEQIHSLRKTFKDLNYNRGLISALWDIHLQQLPPHALTKELMTLLSDNQDLSMALQYLQDGHSRELPETECEQLTGMTLSLAAQKIRTKENLAEKLRHWQHMVELTGRVH
jgi:CHAD domain-containing protein